MVTHFNADDYAKNLTGSFRKTKESNNYKLLDIEKSDLAATRAATQDVFDSLDLDKAFGKTLDLYGEMIGQARGVATDSQYRVLLRSAVVRNLSTGSYDSVITYLTLVFGCEVSDIVLAELEAPCSVSIYALPFAILNRLAIDIDTAVKIIKRTLPAGVYLAEASFTGTFEFSGGTDLVADAEKGFADAEQTVGGYLGALIGGDASDLPV